MVKGWEAKADIEMGSWLRDAANGRCECSLAKRRGIMILVWYLFCVHVLETWELLLLLQVIWSSTIPIVSVIFKETKFGNSQSKCLLHVGLWPTYFNALNIDYLMFLTFADGQFPLL